MSNTATPPAKTPSLPDIYTDRHGSLGSAARAMGVPESTLSKALRRRSAQTALVSTLLQHAATPEERQAVYRHFGLVPGGAK